MRGKLIVFEGADGSGKTTQSKLLVEYLAKNKIPIEYISFPRYEQSLWGKMVRRFLDGDFGKIDEVDPYFASVLYAGDRFSAADKMKKWINDGKIIVCNRYMGSNIGHMAAKIKSQSEKSKYIKWLEKLEYGENGIPREDLVIFLHVPADVSRKLMKDRKLDIHEENLEYLSKVIKVYEMMARTRKNWTMVDCTGGGKILPFQEIHEQVLEVLNERGMLRTSRGSR